MTSSSSIITTPYISSSNYYLTFTKQYVFPSTETNRLRFPRKSNKSKLLCKSVSDNTFAVSSYSTTIETPVETTTSYDGVSERIQLLVSEFRSLTEPIDRVKRLLHYAAALAPLEESARVPENRVKGCTTQVWLEARLDKSGKMRFRADSDSEITKGFCSCLIWMMDGGDPEEVAGVRAEDLAELNVGVHGKAQSRVNTWQNVLISMRDKTEALVLERQRKLLPPPFPSLILSSDATYTRI
ncbi:hypothetical protein COLO4_23479 [Corchorus olitorius]|uniref:Fe-S metabolism associated domain-containing protein n=1 Tax=Corchorus olitorius TaxID=93759 RepID=A0A1R3IG89_9ROSI|nr:hypothetical protein COLO4_23479 [Corchorus olitorius]